MKDNQRKAMFARLRTTRSNSRVKFRQLKGEKIPLPVPIRTLKLSKNEVNNKIWLEDGANERIIFIDDKKGRNPITVFADRKERGGFNTLRVFQFKTRTEGLAKANELRTLSNPVWKGE